MKKPKSTRMKVMEFNPCKPSNPPGDSGRMGLFARCRPVGQGGFVFSGRFCSVPVTSRNASVISIDTWTDGLFSGRVEGSSRVFLMHDL